MEYRLEQKPGEYIIRHKTTGHAEIMQREKAEALCAKDTNLECYPRIRKVKIHEGQGEKEGLQVNADTTPQAEETREGDGVQMRTREGMKSFLKYRGVAFPPNIPLTKLEILYTEHGGK